MSTAASGEPRILSIGVNEDIGASGMLGGVPARPARQTADLSLIANRMKKR